MIKEYEKLYKYCTTTKVHGKLYKERLKQLRQLTLKMLRFEIDVLKEYGYFILKGETEEQARQRHINTIKEKYSIGE